MRILYYHRTMGDGAEGIHIREMVEALRTLGHDVRVTGPTGEPKAHAVRHQSALGGIARLIPESVYEVAEIGYNAVARAALSSEVRRFRPDVIYDRYNTYSTAAVATARAHRIPVVLEVNTIAYERTAYEHHRLRMPALAERYERWICHAADHIFVVSSPLRRVLIEQHAVDPSRVTVLPNGANPTTFTPHVSSMTRTRLNVGRAVVIGFVGILRPWHGVDVFLQAIVRLLRHGHDVHALIVGDGPMENALRQMSRDERVEDRVTFTGRVSHLEVRDYIGAMDIAVSPRATFYASPMKILEYMAMGKPVLAPAMDNIRDLIEDGRTGVLFEPEDVADLVRRLEALIVSGSDRARIGTAARQAIERSLNWGRNATVVEATARRLLSRFDTLLV